MNGRILVFLTFCIKWSQSDCNCGRGGLCKVYNDDPTLAVSADPCSCSLVSKEIFLSTPDHCNVLVKRCNNVECVSPNKCVDGFGTIVCICSKDWEGQYCTDPHSPEFAWQLVRVWYPVSGWRYWEPIIATVQPLQDARLFFRFEDGLTYEVNEEGCEILPFQRVISRCGSGEDCDHLKEMEKYMNSIYYACQVPVPFRFQIDPLDAVYIKGILGPVGFYHDVDIAIVQRDKTLFEHEKFRVFLETGPFIRKCPHQVKFYGCNGDDSSPDEYRSGSKINLITTIIPLDEKEVCPVKEYWVRWYVSSLYQYRKSKLIGDTQVAVFRPYDFGLYFGLVPITVKVVFGGIVNMPDELLTTMCYVKLVRSKLKLTLLGFSQIYECGANLNIVLSATITTSTMPPETYKYEWSCPNEICGLANRGMRILRFWVEYKCRKTTSFHVTLTVSHNRTHEKANYEGILYFSPNPHEMIVICDPDCNEVNPGRQLKIVIQESPDLGHTFEWVLPIGVEVDRLCGQFTVNSIVLGPHTLKKGMVYEFTVKSLVGSKQFYVRTLPGPEHVNCIVIPLMGHPFRDKFNVTCTGDSDYKPLTYWVYEGENDLIVTSSSRRITNLELTDGRITVRVVDSAGVMQSVKFEVLLQRPTEDELLGAILRVPVRLQHLLLKLYAKDYNGVANEVDSITKLSLSVKFPLPWLLNLWDIIVRIQVCSSMDCVVKKLNSVRRLLSIKTNNDTVGADDFILKAGVALFSITKSLHVLCDNDVTSDVYGLVPVLSTLHEAIIQVMEFVDPVLFYPFVDEDIRQIHYRKVLAGTNLARRAMLEMGQLVAGKITHQSPPFEQRAGDEGKKVIVISHNLKYINCILAKDTKESYIQFTPEAMKTLSHSPGIRLAVVVIHYGKKYFWWAKPKSLHYGNMMEVFVLQMVHGKWKKVSIPAESATPVETLITSVQIPTGIVNGTVVNPNNSISSTILDDHVNVLRLRVPRGHGTLHLVFSDNLIGKIQVYIDIFDRPDFITMNGTELLQTTNLYYEYYSKEVVNYVYVGIWSRRPSLNYTFNISLVRCVLWGEQMWKSEACRFVKYVQNDTVMCICRHLSLFNVVTSVPLVEVAPSIEIQLETIMYYNWAVLGVILGVLAVFSLILCIVRRVDKKDRKTAIFLEDNYPGEQYPYLVAVFTGGRYSAGTSAKVAIRLVGDKLVSRVHILNPARSEQTLEIGQDNWFILFTKRRLGDIKEIVLWHDNTGPGPDWYCSEVAIWDLNKGFNYVFTVKTWITYMNLYERRATAFVFKIGTDITTVVDRVGDLFLLYMRQSHHWISIFLIHPRSPYSRVDRTILAFVLVLVASAASVAFVDVGTADAPTVTIETSGIVVACVSLLFSIMIVTVIAQLFRFGKSAMIKDEVTSLGWVLAKQKLGIQAKRYLVFPINLSPIINESSTEVVRGKLRRFMPSWWVLVAYFTSGVVIATCIALIVFKGWGLGRNSFIIWIIIFMIAIGCEAFILDPILVATTTLLVAVFVERESLDLVLVGVDPLENTVPFLEMKKRLAYALCHRVRSCYKPPLWSKVKRIRSVKPSGNYAKTIIFIILFVLTLSLVHYTERKIDFFMNEQLEELFTGKSPDGLDMDAVRNRSRYFQFLRTTVMPALHRTTWYNGRILDTEWVEPIDPGKATKPTRIYHGFCADYSTKMLGVPRLRQQRMSPFWQIAVPAHFSNAFSYAYPHLYDKNGDTETYSQGWGKPQRNRTYYKLYRYMGPEATGAGWILGPGGTSISGGGYVESLHWSLGDSLSMLIDFQVDGWLDNATRYVFITFNLYNMYADKISYLTIITECLPSGVYRSRTLVESASFSVAQLQWERLIIVIVTVLMIVLTVQFSMTLTIISQHGFRSYLKRADGNINIALIITGYGVIVTCINRYIRFVGAFEDFGSAARDVYSPLYARFYQNQICLVFIAVFSWLVCIFGSVHIHTWFGIEAIDKAISRIRNIILVKFVGIMTLYFCYTYGSVSFVTSEIPHFFFILSFKESSVYVQYGESIVYTGYVIFAIVLFVILNKFNTAAFYKRYTEAVYKPTLIDPISRLRRRERAKMDFAHSNENTPVDSSTESSYESTDN